MRAILDHCGNIPLEDMAGGTVLLGEGQTTGRVYVLAQGRIEVLREDVQIAVLDEPGSLVGEMSVLLGVPHTATARTVRGARPGRVSSKPSGMRRVSRQRPAAASSRYIRRMFALLVLAAAPVAVGSVTVELPAGYKKLAGDPPRGLAALPEDDVTGAVRVVDERVALLERAARDRRPLAGGVLH